MTRQDVVWVTLESVRWDHTSLSERSRDTTPTLSRLAAEGRSYDDCFSHDIWTRASTASILTGRASSAHRTWSNDAALPDSIATIPEAFGDAGYRTVGISPNGQFGPGTGLDRGFDDFHYLTRSTLVSEAGLPSLLRWAANLRRHSGGITRDGNQHCLGYLSTNVAKRHIRRASTGEEPLFLYVHYGDSHHAYVPPIAWRDRFADDLPMPVDEAVDIALDMSDRMYEHIAATDPFDDDEWTALRTLYDTAIAYVDHLTGELVSAARQRLNDPVIVVTADHGELFGERGLLAHMLVNNAAVANVPLVVAGANEFPEAGPIQHADVMKMLCRDLDVDHPVPVGRDLREEEREFTVVQRGGARTRNKLAQITKHNRAFPEGEYHTDDVTALFTPEWCYRRTDDDEELVARGTDEADVSDTRPTVTAELREECQRWLAEHGQPVGQTGRADFDENTEAQLRELGYLQ
ncbi:sulfatase [Halosimplex carlsbadense 2-9-1]|uniref:Sulfatase n=1 Tax=Halosimplex carlsbadense 2-9-1 TaxID=797114 RepID=M0CKG5_9EURY|nr:sulfatase-like hydrolase/transferase [Halosimplex carlsbadense]ELZ23108.1 sulfatase [Halosimplex carlsbadense 2-9-1]